MNFTKLFEAFLFPSISDIFNGHFARLCLLTPACPFRSVARNTEQLYAEFDVQVAVLHDKFL